MERFYSLTRKLRLFCYRYFFGRSCVRTNNMTATEAVSIDVIRLLGMPTVSEFAAFVGISQPNATYKIKNLVKKGYLKRHRSGTDKRECRLEVVEQAGAVSGAEQISQVLVERLRAYYSEEELLTAEKVLNTAFELLRQEENL